MKIFSVIFATLLAMSTVASFAADEFCIAPKAECLEYVREAAELGNAKAQSVLGLMYHKGEGVTKDYREAVRWYRLAAEQGYAAAHFALGVAYFKGDGVAQDKREAYIWFLIAKAGGIERVDNVLQSAIWQEYLVFADTKSAKREAARRFKAIENRNETEFSDKSLGQSSGESSVIKSPDLFDADNCQELDDLRKTECSTVIRLAAGLGIAQAQFFLGLIYAEGFGEKINKREAARWYRLAAEQGHAEAQFNLGGMYLLGESVEEDEREAYIWLLIAKASGSENASEVVQELPWQEVLTSEVFESANREAAQRFEKIKKRKNSAESSDSNSSQKSGEEFAIAKPPEETNIAAEVFENTWRSVVMIKNAEGQGSGVIIRPNLVATNCHVIEGGDVAVYKPENGRINENAPFSAKTIYRKEEHDFCILEVKGLWGIATTIRKYDTLKVGENVYALGAPHGLDMSLSDGLISQLRADSGGRLIQTNAAISPGSSGGGLFDKKGNFIGILTGTYNDEDTQGIGFAIPADLALEF